MGESNTYKLNVSVLRACDRGTAGEPLRLPRSRPSLARAARAFRDTRADAPDDQRIPFCRQYQQARHRHVKAARRATIWDIEQRAEAPAEGRSSLGTHSCTNARHTRSRRSLTGFGSLAGTPMLSVDSVRTVFHRSRGIFSLGPPN